MNRWVVNRWVALTVVIVNAAFAVVAVVIGNADLLLRDVSLVWIGWQWYSAETRLARVGVTVGRMRKILHMDDE